MKLMHVDASAKRERSNSRALSRYFLERLRAAHADLQLDYLDVAVDTPPHVDEAFAIATYAAPHERTPAMQARLAASDALCKRVLTPTHWSWPCPCTTGRCHPHSRRLSTAFRAAA